MLLNPYLTAFLCAFSFAAALEQVGEPAYTCNIDKDLAHKLSNNASISHAPSLLRWSEYDAPQPGSIVNVATEEDVLLTVQYCVACDVEFLAQNGGNAWIPFSIGQNDVVINLALLNNITFKTQGTQVTIQGGANISDVVEAAYEKGVQVPTGNCNCVGAIGAILGGGYGRLMGLYGFGVDNIISFNLVTAFGSLITVTPKNADLWWALRGAGANFGIVTSVTMKSYPVPSPNGAWVGALIFTEDKIESLVQAINDLVLEPPMAIFLNFLTSNGQPVVAAVPFYVGNAAQGRAAFQSIYDLDPVADTTAFTPYNKVNSGSDPICVKGNRKPASGAGLAKLSPSAFRAIWNEFTTFIENPGTNETGVLVECYSLQKAQSLPDSSSSFPWRHSVRFNGLVYPWYSNRSLDSTALAFVTKVRDLWRASSGLSMNSTYINFAHGDENLQTIYGQNVQALQALKKTYDPLGKFDQFFPLSL